MSKASAQITLHYVIDVKATYRYYLLQSSTLSAPSKPTEYPPSSDWNDTEPSYTSGSTNSLYFVDCTIFADDSFSYSEVSLSSSYEAAKEAYNKAQNAQNTADDAQTNVDEIRQEMIERNTSIISDCEEIILSALKSYVETSDYDEFKETVESELLVMADSISANFTETTAKIETVDGNLQSKLNEIQKHIEFSIDGIRISSSEGEMSIRIDNDIIVFEKNGVQFGWWDGNDFHTGNIKIDVTERAQFGNYAFVPRSDGSLSFLKVDNKSGLYAILAGGVMSIYGAYPTLDGTTLVISDSAGSLDGTTLIIGGE